MIHRDLEYIFNKAIRQANELKLEYLTLETILLALLDDEEVVDVVDSCGGRPDVLRQELKSFLRGDSGISVLSDDEIEELASAQFANEEIRKIAEQDGIRYQPEISLSLQRVIQRAALHVQSSGKKKIKGLNILVAMFSEKESFATHILEKQGVHRLNVIDYISHGLDRPLKGGAQEEPQTHVKTETAPHPEEGKDLLDKYCTNLNQLVREGKVDPIIGRELEIQRMIQILGRRRKNNPLLVGDSGVGKTALAEGLALAIEEKKVPDFLNQTSVLRLDMATLVAGTKFRGDFEERLKGVVKAAIKRNESKYPCILFIDEIHTIIGAGATSGGSMDASNLLKPALASGEIRCLGSTTFTEYRKFFEKDAALTRRFQKVEVKEPSVSDCYKILEGLRSKFEEHHQLKYPPSVIKAAVDLSVRHISERQLPDKAIDVIDEAGSYVRLKAGKQRSQVTVKDVEDVVSLMARIPKRSVSTDEKSKLKNLEGDLKMILYGQDEAVEKVTSAIHLARSGLSSHEGPIASFLFAGPTGVGKTELAKQLAGHLGIHFQRFDMSEYMEKHSVAKLIGAPPGYVGFDQGGVLTEAIHQNPHAVLLLDEIEKAHPDITNILLQIMDHGALTDSNGRTTDFRNVIVIMTTNAGAKEMEAGAIGLAQKTINTTKRDQALKNYFSPEFRNRLSAIIQFNKLSEENILMIVEKFIIQLEEQLREKNVAMDLDSATKQWLAEIGYDDKLGARPIKRTIDEKIRKPLAQEILFGKLVQGGKVFVTKDGKNLKFRFEKK